MVARARTDARCLPREACAAWILLSAAALGGCGDRASLAHFGGSGSAALVRCAFLAPAALNDGTPTPRAVLDALEQQLTDAFGGFTRADGLVGAYRANSGAVMREPVISYVVAVPPDELDTLIAMVRDLGRTLRQEAMYFEHPGGRVEVLSPPREPSRPTSPPAPPAVAGETAALRGCSDCSSAACTADRCRCPALRPGACHTRALRQSPHP